MVIMVLNSPSTKGAVSDAATGISPWFWPTHRLTKVRTMPAIMVTMELGMLTFFPLFPANQPIALFATDRCLLSVAKV